MSDRCHADGKLVSALAARSEFARPSLRESCLRSGHGATGRDGILLGASGALSRGAYPVGACVGAREGDPVGPVGSRVGSDEGAREGLMDGATAHHGRQDVRGGSTGKESEASPSQIGLGATARVGNLRRADAGWTDQ
jgi:hypothetical protein